MTPETDDADRPPTSSVLREGLHVAVLLALVAGTVAILWARSEVRFQPAPDFVQVLPPPPPGTPPADCGPPSNGGPIVVDMLYSVEKQAWIEEAATLFARRCPNIQVRLQVTGDIVGAEAILGGEASPTVWSPSDEIVVAYLEHRNQARGTDPLLTAGSVSLLRSPLVILMWEERLRVYSEIRKRTAANNGLWSQLLCALIPPDPPVDTVALEDRIPGLWSEWYDKIVLAPARQANRDKPAAAPRPSPKRPLATPPEPAPEPTPEPEVTYKAPFPTVERIAGWEYVQIGHSSPTHTAAGLGTLYLMAFDHLLPPDVRPAAAIVSDEFDEGPIYRSEHLTEPLLAAYAAREEPLRKWLARCEGGFEGDPKTTQLLTETMFHLGGELYDGVATYEHLVFPVLERLEGNAEVMEKMTVVYPPVTLVSQHPARILAGADELQVVAARLWLAFLTETAMQHRAIELGFRPANRDVKIREHHVDANPFLRFRRYGVQFNSPFVEPPRLGGERVNQLLELWRDATGRN